MNYNQKILIIYGGILILMSLITFITYGIDKAKAKKETRRIKEKTLLEMTILGGAIGALFGRIIFHHKTNKIYFSITIYLSLIAQISLMVLAAILGISEKT